MYIGETRRRGGRPVVVVVGLLAALVVCLGAFWAGPEPQLELTSDLPGIGPATRIEAFATEPSRGIGELRLELVQDGTTYLLAEASHTQRPYWKLWGAREAEVRLSAFTGSDSTPGLVPGPAVVRLTAQRAPAWIRRPRAVTAQLDLTVDLEPPTAALVRRPGGVRQGGAGVVLYEPDGDSVDDGVRVRERWFPGADVPGEPGQRFALFAIPLDMAQDEDLVLVARDALGNESRVPVPFDLSRRTTRSDTIRLSDGFFGKVVPEIASRTPGLELPGDDPLESYLVINRSLRADNQAAIANLASRTGARFFWNAPFLRLPGAKQMAGFGDRRTYSYNGREVDRQTHLGLDLASLKQSPVPAAGHGVVVMSEYLGIYGNTVVLDHGCGLMTLYAHLTAMAVEVGDEVARGQEIGRTGETGLAGGDHLHFSVLVHGAQADPREWFDGRWIESRLVAALGGGFILEQPS
jgi:murein DD-endopeptidase MepM/ murein hydrolase activator NlpD